jgi:hypothetical protein
MMPPYAPSWGAKRPGRCTARASNLSAVSPQYALQPRPPAGATAPENRSRGSTDGVQSLFCGRSRPPIGVSDTLDDECWQKQHPQPQPQPLHSCCSSQGTSATPVSARATEAPEAPELQEPGELQALRHWLSESAKPEPGSVDAALLARHHSNSERARTRRARRLEQLEVRTSTELTRELSVVQQELIDQTEVPPDGHLPATAMHGGAPTAAEMRWVSVSRHPSLCKIHTVSIWRIYLTGRGGCSDEDEQQLQAAISASLYSALLSTDPVSSVVVDERAVDILRHVTSDCRYEKLVGACVLRWVSVSRERGRPPFL